MKKNLFFTLFVFFYFTSFSQLVNENFNYSTGALTANGGGANVSGGAWTLIGGTVQLNVVSGNLSYAGYPSSGIGNRLLTKDTSASAEDSYTSFATRSTGSVYSSFLLNVVDTNRLVDNSTAGDYMIALLASNSTTNYANRVTFRKGSSPNTFNIGLRVTSTGSTVVAWSPVNYTPGSTYLIVSKYVFIAGSANDSGYLWVNPVLNGVEPTPTIATAQVGAATDLADIARFAVRQSGGTPESFIDGIRVDTSWANVAGQPSTITSFTPSSGPIGSLVTITGTNLSDPSALTIGGVAAIPISNTGTSLVAMVMPGATTGGVSVTTGGGTANSGSNFTVVASQVPNGGQQGNKLSPAVATSLAAFGYAVDISADGNTAVVGGIGDNNSLGGAWIYTRSGATWTEQAKLSFTGNTGTSINFGYSVSISADGNTVAVGATNDDGSKGAVWIFVRTGTNWAQQGSKLVGTSSAGASMGSSVALSADGNTLVSGGYTDVGNTGAAWIFIRTGTTWTQQGAKLVGTGFSGTNILMGISVAISANGNTVIVGGSADSEIGAFWTFTRSGTTWTQMGSKVVPTGYADFAPNDGMSVAFGATLALSADGNTAVVGAPGDNNDGASSVGAVWVFTRSGNTWTQQGSKLIGTGSSTTYAYQGASVDVSADGNILIFGATLDDYNATTFTGTGATWVFTRSGVTWTQQGAKLVGIGATSRSNQGQSVAISSNSNYVIVGGINDQFIPADGGGKGAAWIFQPPTTWNGSTWNNDSPTNTVDAIIASSTAPSSFTCKALTINSGVALTTTGITATVNGNIVNNGNGIAGTGGLIIAANSTISGTAISFNGALTVNTGATLTTGGLLTLASNATNTARVANSAGVIDGSVSVQRYLPGKRAYRFVTAPLSSNGLSAVNVNNSWQLNTHIVGPSGTGLDATKPLYSMLTYGSGAWSGVSNTTTTTLFNSTTTASNKAFALFVTGDRTVDINNHTAFNNSTLSATGKLLQGTQTFSLGSQTANSYHFIGNPYASPVDLNAVFLTAGTSNINRTFYTWDPTLSTTGGYVTISWNGTSYTITPGAGTSQTQILQSGQAFFVQATATATTSVVFEENDKSTTNINNVFGIGNGNTDNLNINLQRIENGNLSTRDGVTASFGSIYNKAVNFNEDAEKLFNNEEGITIKRGTTNLSIERRPYITNTNDTIFLGLNRLVPNTNYTLNLNAQGWDAGMQAVLVDKLLSTETPINLQSATQDISITSATENATDRFMIVFRGTGNLPNNKLSLVATKRDKDVQLTWNIANEIGVKEYELQRSIDGTNFQAINNQVASNKGEYNNLDSKANNGINYYRVKMTMLNDDTRFSNVISFNMQHSSSNIISIYPNPVKGKTIGLQLAGLDKGDYALRLVNAAGQTVYSQNLQLQGSHMSMQITTNQLLAKGSYSLQLISNKGTTYNQQVLVVE